MLCLNTPGFVDKATRLAPIMQPAVWPEPSIADRRSPTEQRAPTSATSCGDGRQREESAGGASCRRDSDQRNPTSPSSITGLIWPMRSAISVGIQTSARQHARMV